MSAPWLQAGEVKCPTCGTIRVIEEDEKVELKRLPDLPPLDRGTHSHPPGIFAYNCPKCYEEHPEKFGIHLPPPGKSRRIWSDGCDEGYEFTLEVERGFGIMSLFTKGELVHTHRFPLEDLVRAIIDEAVKRILEE